MDEASELTDAYVEMRLADHEPLRTEIRKKTLDPVWNQDFRLEVSDDSDWQDNPLVVQVWDHDILKNDSIGSVFIDLNVLLMASSQGRDLHSQTAPTGQVGQLAGWFPLYDTIRGVCGELLLTVKLQVLGNKNPHRDSSAGVYFFSGSVPPGITVNHVMDLVDELIMEDDPAHQWAESFRTQRNSNEAKQMLFYQLSGKIRRQLGVKVHQMGANAVLGFHQHFDLEGHGVVLRAYGTAAKTVFTGEPSRAASAESHEKCSMDDSAGALAVLSEDSLLAAQVSSRTRTLGGRDEKQERKVKLLSIGSLPPLVLRHIGCIVSATSVKLVNTKVADQLDTRDAWWEEVRDEIRQHAQTLGCTHVIGYRETASVQGDVVVIFATGTAVVLDVKHPYMTGDHHGASSEDLSTRGGRKAAQRRRRLSRPICKLCHLPYSPRRQPLPVRLKSCRICKSSQVPNIIMCTTEPPANMPIKGTGQMIEARIVRSKDRAYGKDNARLVGEAAPFLQYELYQQLECRLHVLGMNACFRLELQIALGETMIVATATATAFFLPALPPPPRISVPRPIAETDSRAAHFAAVIMEQNLHFIARAERSQVSTVAWGPYTTLEPSVSHVASLEHLQPFDRISPSLLRQSPKPSTAGDKSEESESSTESSTSVESSTSEEGKLLPPRQGPTFVLDTEEPMDESLLALLCAPSLPPGMGMANTQSLPGWATSDASNAMMITSLKKVMLVRPGDMSQQLSHVFNALYSALAYRLVSRRPCCVLGVRTSVELPTDGEVVVVLTAMAFEYRNPSFEPPPPGPALLPAALVPPILPRLAEPEKKKNSSSSSTDTIEDDSGTPSEFSSSSEEHVPGTHASAGAVRAGAVTISSNSFIPGAPNVKYLGRLALFLVKETALSEASLSVDAVVQGFILEGLGLLRAHAASLGGTAVLGYRLDILDISHNYVKNEVYCIIQASGDCVRVDSGG